jgi:molecular chaperone GrpE
MPEDEETGNEIIEEKSDEPTEQEAESQDDLLKRLKYLQAEYENYKKRTAKEMEVFAEYSYQKIFSTILPVVDDLEKAGNTIKDEEDANGVKMIYSNLLETLRNEGVEEIGAVGDDFDPFKHECVSHVENGEMESNKIVEVIQKGYSFRSKILRPSKVVVVKNEVKEEGNGEDDRDRSGDD